MLHPLLLRGIPAALFLTTALPWAATHAATSSSSLPVPPACRSSMLTASLDWQGATGALVGRLAVTNSTATTCLLTNPPQIRLLAGDTAVSLKPSVSWNATEGAPVRQIDLAAHQQAGALILWSNWCGPKLRPPLMALIRLSGDSLQLAAEAPVPTLNGYAGTPRCDQSKLPSTLIIGPFDPADLPTDAAALAVRGYYGAINEQQWPLAWHYVAPTDRTSYNTWLAGYRSTTAVRLLRLITPRYRIHRSGAAYTCVAAQFTARQRSGGSVTYGGYYLVRITPALDLNTDAPGSQIGTLVLSGSHVHLNGAPVLPSAGKCTTAIPQRTNS